MERVDLNELLAWVNEVRVKYDLGPSQTEMPKGAAWGARKCPLARALSTANGPRFYGPRGASAYVTEFNAYLPTPGARLFNDRVTLKLPSIAKNFVCGFDEGLYPELVE